MSTVQRINTYQYESSTIICLHFALRAVYKSEWLNKTFFLLYLLTGSVSGYYCLNFGALTEGHIYFAKRLDQNLTRLFTAGHSDLKFVTSKTLDWDITVQLFLLYLKPW
jgi:hypothetical protein